MFETIKNIICNLDPENNFSDHMLFIFIALVIMLLFAIIFVGGAELLAKKFNLYEKISKFFKSDED